jgi:HAD superfamily hydrolase (TIGR01509 family)
MNKKYSCIIFDCDGVLVDSEAISAKVFQEMLSELGCELKFELVLDQITGTSMKENLKFFAECAGSELPDGFEKDFRARSFEAFKTDLQPIPGVHELIDKIKIPIGVASSGPVNKIKLNLTTIGLIDKFGDNIFSSYDIKSWKPEPDIYLHAANQMGFQPNECAVVEDSIAGVKAATAGGFDVYALSNKSMDDTFKSLGAKVFQNMEELGNLLKIH